MFQQTWLILEHTPNNPTHLIPEINIKSEIDVRVLMMVIMENCIRLPWLPPLRLEGDARVIDNSMIIGVQQNSIKENLAGKRNIISMNICM